MFVGAVLTGGASRRMGRTKALIELDGIPMASIVVRTLLDAGCQSVVAVGGDPEELARLGVVVVPDEAPGQGPLGGVISALACAAGEDAASAVVVACDLPSLRSSDVLLLVTTALENPAADVVVARTDRLEPACAVWNVQCLAVLRRMFATGERAIHPVIAQLKSIEVAVDRRALRNVNTPADLKM